MTVAPYGSLPSETPALIAWLHVWEHPLPERGGRLLDQTHVYLFVPFATINDVEPVETWP